jgi:glyoxylase-like metal-dependent hydrolase (beta-lactamase superfamily II)
MELLMTSTTRVIILVLTMTVAGTPVRAQQQDLSAVQIKVTKLSGNFHTVEGSGGMIGALVGPDGIFLVDSQFPPLTEKIVAALKQVSDRPIRYLVNTHLHGDHTGGNENFAKAGVTILSRDELRDRLAKPPKGNPPPAAALPVVTYRGPVSFHMNGDEVQLIPVPAAHTDGDTMVYFPAADVLMTGDFYRSVGYPNIDRQNGGTLKGMIEGLNAVIALAKPTTKIVPGHGPIVSKVEVTAHRDLITALRDKVAPLVKQGQTQEQVTAAKLTAEFDAKVPQAGTTGDRFIGQLFAELQGTK